MAQKDRQTAVADKDSVVDGGKRPGFDITFETVVGRIEYGDGDQLPTEAAMARIGRAVATDDLGNGMTVGRGGTFRFPLGEGNGQMIELALKVSADNGFHEESERALRLVLTRMVHSNESPRSAVKSLHAQGALPDSVSLDWLTDRVTSLVNDDGQPA